MRYSLWNGQIEWNGWEAIWLTKTEIERKCWCTTCLQHFNFSESLVFVDTLVNSFEFVNIGSIWSLRRIFVGRKRIFIGSHLSVFLVTDELIRSKSVCVCMRICDCLKCYYFFFVCVRFCTGNMWATMMLLLLHPSSFNLVHGWVTCFQQLLSHHIIFKCFNSVYELHEMNEWAFEYKRKHIWSVKISKRETKCCTWIRTYIPIYKHIACIFVIA